MSQPRVEAYFEGDRDAGGEVYVTDLSKLCDRVSSCLKANEQALSEDPPNTRYRVAKLQSGSIDIAFAPSSFTVGDIAGEAIELFNSTVTALQEGKPVDSRIGRAALEKYKRLADGFLRGRGRLRLSGVGITSAFLANIDRLLGAEVTSEGSFKGRIERLNVHNRYECALYTPLLSEGITCTFDKDLFDQVRQAVGSNVSVEGTMHFEGDSAFPARINVKAIRVFRDDDELPTLGSLRGVLGPEAFAGLSTDAYLSSVRDGKR